MSLLKPARKLHKILSYFVFIQVTLWIVGGAYFALVPFKPLVKGQDYYQPPALTADPLSVSETIRFMETPLESLSISPSAQGPLLKTNQSVFSVNTGHEALPIDKDAIARFAQTLYTGPGSLKPPTFLDTIEPKVAGLVDEVGGRRELWLVEANDGPGTRLYFDAYGTLVTVRNDAWVGFDLLWKLHIMDYGEGEDFNNPLLMVFSVSALLFALSGCVLAIGGLRQSLSRRLTRRRRARG
ncbi:hypothetical protein [Ferrimonas futtsuensis]|uniref:hypothetical protein n=1 Tax=Ferrimonas futtsuensis TaxID=364764 RepID=UPI00040A5C1A|nr:hypothetical protein [Ferrimonas futtsuensis]